MVSVQSVLTVDPGLNPTPENINRISLIPQAKENDFNDQIVKKMHIYQTLIFVVCTYSEWLRSSGPISQFTMCLIVNKTINSSLKDRLSSTALPINNKIGPYIDKTL